MAKPSFRFKRFTVQQDRCALKVGTDGVLFGAWVNYDGAERILDIGSGTGVLALIAAQRNETARIDAVEIDEASAGQAAGNFASSPWSDRLHLHRMDVRRMHVVEPYDLVICNPPYYEGYSASPDVRIGLAKHSGELRFPELLATVVRVLAPEGRFAVIIPLNREPAFLKDAERVGLRVGRRCTVAYVAHRPAKRVLLQLERSPVTLGEEALVVEATGPFDYSKEYRALIADLMLGF